MNPHDPNTRREPELPDDDWPQIGWRQYLAVAFLIVALAIGVTVHGIG